MDADGKAVVYRPTIETPDYLITDGRGRSFPRFRKQYLHVSSINSENEEYLRELMLLPSAEGTGRKTIYFPVFSYEEYIDIDGDNNNDEKMVSTGTDLSVSLFEKYACYDIYTVHILAV